MPRARPSCSGVDTTTYTSVTRIEFSRRGSLNILWKFFDADPLGRGKQAVVGERQVQRRDHGADRDDGKADEPGQEEKVGGLGVGRLPASLPSAVSAH